MYLDEMKGLALINISWKFEEIIFNIQEDIEC